MRMTAACIVLLLLAYRAGRADSMAGLIVSGLDTLEIPTFYGFDFVVQQSCTTSSYTPPYDCNSHFEFVYAWVEGYLLMSGLGLRHGKTNLDSITWAPHDSVFEKEGYSVHIDSIPPERLQEYVGNVYIIKSGVDPRPFMGNAVYAKIKILELKEVDPENHHVDMAFLWVANRSGIRDLTSAVDTFGTTAVADARESVAKRATVAPRRGAAGLVVAANGVFVVPPQWRGSVERVGVFDVRGRVVRETALSGRHTVPLLAQRDATDGLMVVGPR